MFYDANPLLFERAKYLRNHLTHAEIVLWSYLRNRPMGYKFSRQHPIGIYVVDFYCHALKLVIKADGSIHHLPEVQLADIEREKILEKDGLLILRFSNDEIIKQTSQVIEKINCTLTKIIPPSGGWGL